MRLGIEQYLSEYGPACRNRLTTYYNVELNEFSFLVEKMKEPLFAYSTANPRVNDDDARKHAYALMHKGINALVAGFEIALSGYEREPGILYRNAIETCAVGWDIVTNKTSLDRWRGNKNFDSCSSITALRRIDTDFGILFGLLSNHFVHIDQNNNKPPIHSSDKKDVFQPFGFVPVGNEELVRINIESSLVVAHRCLQLIEISFYPYVVNPESVTEGASGEFVERKVSDRHRKFASAFSKTVATLDKTTHNASL